MDYLGESLKRHAAWRGKLEIRPKMPLAGKEDLALAYTPGVAAPCLEIQKDIRKSFELTGRWNTVAVVTDGSAVLGLGDIGPEAGMPVMEGKCALFKAFGGVDAVPLCVRTQNVDEIVRTVALLAGSFGGINLEDIAAPRCFEIEEKLQAAVEIPVFHDDQHGTAVTALAAVLNALKITGKKLETAGIVIAGAGAAGTATALLLAAMGAKDLVVCDRTGALHPGRAGLNRWKARLAALNTTGKTGNLAEALVGADLFIGVSAPGTVSADMVKTMAEKPVIFAMANPTPEIFPDEAIAAGAAVAGTGRSDFPNQINNVLAFPGIFRGALDARAGRITEKMKIAAALALAGLVDEQHLANGVILPEPFDTRVAPTVAAAVADAVAGATAGAVQESSS